MSERRKLEVNVNDSKNTRMPVAVDIPIGITKTDHLAPIVGSSPAVPTKQNGDGASVPEPIGG